jgi:hypothetical protein
MTTNNYIVRALDMNGDWEFGASLNNYLQNRAAVSQNIQTNLNSFLGDCFFDLGAGINWFFYLGGNGAKDQIALQLAIAAVILNTTYVTGLLQLSVNLNRQTRSFSIAYQVNTTFSVTGNQFIFDLGGSNA